MSFPVIAAPVLIDGSGAGHGSRQTANEINPMGPFINGTNLYVVFYNATSVGIRIFKSTDDGVTWTLEDDSNSPDQGGIDSNSLNVFYDTSSKILYVSYLATGVNRKVVAFDTNADTYAAPIVWGFSTTAFFNNKAVLIRQLSGDLQLFYSDNTSGNINYITLSVSTPSGPTLLHSLAGSKVRIDSGGQDSTGRINLCYCTGSARFYLQVSAALSVTTGPTSIGSTFGDTFRAGYLITSGNSVVFAWTDQNEVMVAIGTPLLNPTFTTYDVFSDPVGGNFNYALPVEDILGNLMVFWAFVSSGDGIDEIDSSTFDGVSTWAAPVLFYDEITNPPPSGTAGLQFIHTMDGGQLADGTWLMITAMETDSPSGCTGFALRIAGSSGMRTLYAWPPISLGAPTPPPGTFSAACPSPVYVVGTPYDSFVTVTGGTGPYTFAVTSGSLPTGLSLNTSTGEITGTPSATGPFSFTITVTDSTMATATTGSCSAGRCPGTQSLL